MVRGKGGGAPKIDSDNALIMDKEQVVRLEKEIEKLDRPAVYCICIVTSCVGGEPE